MGSLHRTQLGIATQVYVIKVKVTVTKIEIQLSHQYLVESLKTWFSSHCGVSCLDLHFSLIEMCIYYTEYNFNVNEPVMKCSPFSGPG